MKVLIVFIIAIAVLYPTIWPHEVGHGVAPYLYGCKKTFWQTDASWYLVSSWSGKDIDHACMQRRGHAALAWGAFGGTAVNLLLLFIFIPILRFWVAKPARSLWLVVLFFWALANYAEAYSYLLLNTAWLKSDMKMLVVESGINRWIIFLAGVVSALAIVWLLKPVAQRAAGILAVSDPSQRLWRFLFVLYVAAVGLGMMSARVVLT